MAQNPYLMNQIAQGFNFNPGGAFMQGQQDRMAMIAAQYQQQLAQMQMAQAQAAQADAEARRAAQGAFARDVLGNPDLGPLVDSNLVSRAVAPGKDNTPAAILEYEYYQSLSPEQRKVWDQGRRGPSVTEIGGVPHVFTPNGFVPLSTLQGEADAAATIRGAEAGASAQAQADVAQQEKEPQRIENARQTIAQIDNTLANIDEALGAAGFWTTGFVGESLSRLAGTPARDFAGTIDTLKASLGFNTLQQMRNASPTGGALGSISERELTLLTAAIESLDQGQSTGQILRNLQAIQQHYQNWRRAVVKSLGEQPAQTTAPAAPAASEPANPQTQRRRYNPETGQLEPQ